MSGFSMWRQRDYPRTIMIRRKAWRVRFRRRLQNGGPEESNRTIGLCHRDKRLIEIRMGLSPRRRLATFCHEVVHAFELEYRCAVPHRIVYMLGEALADLLIGNRRR